MMIAAVKENTQTVAKLQSLTVDAMEDMADAIAAPREIQIQRGKDGKAAGAKSIAVMPKE
jgi:protein involved in temperature-dependent protein secretion